MPLARTKKHSTHTTPHQGKDLPDKPTRAGTSRTVRFNAQLQERYTTPRGSEYVRLTFMPENAKTEGDASVDPADVIDAEFMFLTGRRKGKRGIKGYSHHFVHLCVIVHCVYCVSQ